MFFIIFEFENNNDLVFFINIRNYIQYSNETKQNARISFYLQKTIFLFLFRSFDGKIHRCRLDNNKTVTKTKRKGCTQKEDITSARRITNVSTKTIKEQDIFLLRKILIVMHHPKVIIFNDSCWNYL